MEAWRQELRGMFVEYPGSAERILRALDDNTFNGGLCTQCAYGHALRLSEDEGTAGDAIEAMRVQRGRPAWLATPLEEYVAWINSTRWRDEDRRTELRAECVAYLAESGTTPEPAPQMETEAA